jgi:hypothetical protein
MNNIDNKYYKKYLLYKKKYLSLKRGGAFGEIVIEENLTQDQILVNAMEDEFMMNIPPRRLIRDYCIDQNNPVQQAWYRQRKLEDHEAHIKHMSPERALQYNLSLRFENAFPFENKEENLEYIQTHFTGLQFFIWVLYFFSGNDEERNRAIEIINGSGIINDVLEEELQNTYPHTYNYYMRFIEPSIVKLSFK